MTTPPSRKDFPPGLEGGIENDQDDHRVGELGHTGPEAPGDVDRSHPNGSRPSPDPSDRPRSP